MAKINKPAQTKAVVSFDEQFAKRAEAQSVARAVSSGGKFIGVSSSGFTYNGKEVDGDLDVVILDYVNENQYYTEAFNPDSPTPPVCFAISRDEKDLAPHEKSTEPQHEQCKGCPQNAFGSAGEGRKGKACKNVMRLAMVTEGEMENDIAAAEVAYMKVSATNVKYFVELLEKMKNPNYGDKRKPSYAFVVTISVKPNKKTQIEMGFKIKSIIDDPELIPGLFAKVDELADAILFPYLPNEGVDEEEAPPPKAKNAKLTARRK